MANWRNWGATGIEIASSLPGDKIIDGPAVEGTRGISIDTDRETLFDFIAQMGFGRAGWYSYDWVDNLGRRSAEEIHPEWVTSAAGDLVPGGPIDFVVAEHQRPRAFVLQLPQRRVAGHQLDFTLAYALKENDSHVRLTTRARVACRGPFGSAIARSILAADGVMIRRQLLGLKARGEAQPRRASA